MSWFNVHHHHHHPLPTTPHTLVTALVSLFRQYLATRKRDTPLPRSVVVVVILGHEDVVFLQQRREVLADLGPNVQEGHHDHGDADEPEGSLALVSPRREKKIMNE